ncbi:hypothetical protein BXZ70DRAFT_950689 [Cristinia sonorae]|uniref:Uncharacterized protein n=1 Tax=Cristinia sonorae TaxID=1940300 RepID=A0A8K0UIS9_9AGAR|nr:hypothetical protein BXZ70DRAFT_950689 [Cristinia sonorae]
MASFKLTSSMLPLSATSHLLQSTPLCAPLTPHLPFDRLNLISLRSWQNTRSPSHPMMSQQAPSQFNNYQISCLRSSLSLHYEPRSQEVFLEKNTFSSVTQLYLEPNVSMS